MIDCRRDLELPSVKDVDPYAEEKLGELILRLVHNEIPGVGIVHREDSLGDAGEIHKAHKLLVKNALHPLLGSGELNLGDSGFDDSCFKIVIDRTSDSYIHVDQIRPGMRRHNNYLQLSMRLHTAGSGNGADVLLVNTAPGFYEEDENSRIVFERDYLNADESVREVIYGITRSRLEFLEQGGYDPFVSESDFYHFAEYPHSSVLFVTQSHLGPATIHRFKSMHTDIHRTAYFSGFDLKAH